jgi:hypothetical protein
MQNINLSPIEGMSERRNYFALPIVQSKRRKSVVKSIRKVRDASLVRGKKSINSFSAY